VSQTDEVSVLAAGRARGQGAEGLLPEPGSVWARRAASRVRSRRAAPALDSARRAVKSVLRGGLALG
jgi:hypothetical protein